MNKTEKFYSDKWRPTLGMIVTAMLIFILMLPLGSIWIFRFYDSQLVRDTENELIAQGAFVKAIFRAELLAEGFAADALTNPMPAVKKRESSIRWIEPKLDLATNPILRSRGDARVAADRPDPSLQVIGTRLTKIIEEAQSITLAGFRVLDSEGTVIAGGNEVGLSLGHIPEVQTALSGKYASVIRERTSESARPPIYSISRGTDIRVFVAMPIEYKGKVAGVVYLSRTPSHFLRELYGQRWKLAGALIFLIFVTLAVATIFVRTIKGPIDALNERTKRISLGDRSAISPLARHGTKEIADLSHGLLSMSQQLQGRADYIRNFANHVSHELKSPITSIRGAAELLKDASNSMNPEDREKFLDNVLGDTDRMTSLLERLRQLAAAENLVSESSCRLSEVISEVVDVYPTIKIDVIGKSDVDIALSKESIRIVLDNLIDNAMHHEATKITIKLGKEDGFAVVDVFDNGSGISKANQQKIFELFFTTRRDHGGTGMGLNIVKSVLEAHGGSLDLVGGDDGTHFRILAPIAGI